MYAGQFTERGRPEQDVRYGKTSKSFGGERFLVRSLTSPGDTVMDVFGGAGTTAIAALSEGRHVVFFDSDPLAITTSTQRVVEFIENERLKAVTLGVKEGSLLDEGSKEAATMYAMGAAGERPEVSEKDVQGLMDILAVYDRALARKWKMEPDAAMVLVKQWLLVQDRSILKGFENTEDSSLSSHFQEMDVEKMRAHIATKKAAKVNKV